jgi:small subunit ribosomal protein S1
LTTKDSNQDVIMDMGELLDTTDNSVPLKKGDITRGIVMRVDSKGIYLSFGQKFEGLVPIEEMKSVRLSAGMEDAEDGLNIGEEISVMVLSDERSDGSVLMSIDKAMAESGWIILNDALTSGEILEGSVTNFNKGGVIVNVHGVDCFVPISQLVSKIHNLQLYENNNLELNQSQNLNKEEDFFHKGDVLKLKVIEANRSTNRSVLSEKLATKQIGQVNKVRIINELNEGETKQGRVSGLSKFGAFVDIGGVDGLVHISELSWSNVKSPSEIVSVGDLIEVYLLRVDKENLRVGLSIKRLLDKPWDTINEKYHVGDSIEVTITNLVEFGAFARIEESIEGLIHISELDQKIVKHPKEIVEEGDVVKVKIVSIDVNKERIGLSIKQVDGYFGTKLETDEFG